MVGRAGRSLGARYGGAAVLLLTGLVCTQTAQTAQSAPPSYDAAAPVRAVQPATAVVSAQRDPADRPNIVVVMADDMRADDLLFTPRVRKLVARHGTTFRNSFSPFPLCCPARASFLTGMYAHNHGVLWHNPPYGYRAFDDSRTLATSLSSAGYTTGYVGKYLNRYGPDTSLVSGRPSYKYVPNGWSDWRATIDANRHVRGSTYNYMDTPFNVNGRVDQRHRGEYQTDVVGAMARDMVTSMARKKKPFFAFVNFLAPHTGAPHEPDDPRTLRDDRGRLQPYETPARPRWVRGRFDRLIGRGAGMPRGGGPSERHISDQPDYFSRQPEPNAREKLALRDVTRQRAESMFVMDREIGRLVQRLKRTHAWSNTVFVFTSDNGYYLGEHRHRTGKVLGHEPSFRVPLLVTGPGLRTPRQAYDPVSTVDVSATILDLADADAPRPADGASVLPTLVSGDNGWDTPVLYEAIYTTKPRLSRGFGDPRTSIGVRTAQYSYIRNYTGKDMLYDLARDPLENHNVAGSQRYASIQGQLDTVWTALKDCQGSGCQVPLPPDLAADPALAAALGRSYWQGVMKTYGFT